MSARDDRALARLERLAGCLRSYAGFTAASPVLVRFLIKVESSIPRLRRLSNEQYSLAPSRAGEGKRTAGLRKRLRREYMIPLARVGRQLFRFAPTVERTLKVPHARASHRELITTADAMLEAVQPHRKLLVAAGFSKTFLTEFRNVARELRRQTTTHSARHKKLVEVNRKLREELATANDAMRVIDGLVLGVANRDRSLGRIWKKALRTPKPLGRPPAQKQKLSPNERPPRDSGGQPLTV